MSIDFRCEVCQAKPGEPCRTTLKRKDGNGPQSDSLLGRSEHHARVLSPTPKRRKEKRRSSRD